MDIQKKRLVSTPGATYNNYMAMANGNGMIIAAGKIVTNGKNAFMSISKDQGNTWQDIDSGIPFHVYGMCYAQNDTGGLFVVVGKDGNIAYSSNGTSWKQANIKSDGNSLTDVDYNTSLNCYCAVGVGGKILYSTDAINWTKESTTSQAQLEGVRQTPEGFLIVGSSGAAGLYIPGSNSTTFQNIGGLNVYGCLFNPELKLYLAGGKDAIYFASTNGSNWERHRQPPYMAYFWKIADVKGRCVTIGNADVPFPTAPYVGKQCAFFAISENGYDYTRYYTPDGDSKPTALRAICSDDKNIYACGDREYLIVANIDWS